MSRLQIKRGTRAQLDAAKAASGLYAGEPYLITDEGRYAVGTAVNAYVDFARNDEMIARTTRTGIINGRFDIWQRGDSQTVSGYRSDDRWLNYSSGSPTTHSKQTFALGQTDVPGNPKYYSRTVVTSVANTEYFVVKQHRIESVLSHAGEDFIVEFYAKADANKNIAVECFQVFGSGGTPSAHVLGIGSQLVALTTSWAKKTVSFSIPSISGKTLGTNNDDYLVFQFWLEAGSYYASRTANLGQQSGTFDIAMVCNPGIEQRTFAEELALCQRYYEITNYNIVNHGITALVWTANNIAVGYEKYRVIKRANPTITFYGTPRLVGFGAAPNVSLQSLGSSIYGVPIATTTNVANAGAYLIDSFIISSDCEL